MSGKRFEIASSLKLSMTGSDAPQRIDGDASRRFMPVEQFDEPAPMALAEAAECCGEFLCRSADDANEGCCANCPMLVERKREEFLRKARAH
ncbi:hypothetical protein QMZ05_12725 [Bradyrhizobium sp. INPA03-11B]|uniref:hypothetical protein n=1 Tax=Bradyrhizobium sp. INPA03-11B TaxID=418598 RepID=UPI00338EA83B